VRYRHPREIEEFDNLATQPEEVFTPHRGRKLNVKKPGFIRCAKCDRDFWPTGKEERRGALQNCPKCRKAEEDEARFLNHPDPSQLSDSELPQWICRKISAILEAA
jgi:hypothetical protein